MVDTVGAGDCFFAGLLSALLHTPAVLSGLRRQGRLDEAEALRVLRHAIASASLCVQARGCVPPSEAAIQAWLASA